jgi:hypothetical protein
MSDPASTAGCAFNDCQFTGAAGGCSTVAPEHAAASTPIGSATSKRLRIVSPDL